MVTTGLGHLEALQGKDRHSVMRIAVKCPGHGKGSRGRKSRWRSDMCG